MEVGVDEEVNWIGSWTLCINTFDVSAESTEFVTENSFYDPVSIKADNSFYL